MTASEASRNFSALLDDAEHGETIMVTRSGRRVAVIMPAPQGNGEALARPGWAGSRCPCRR
ncbi:MULTISPECIES: type II toxin-antitoxin system Phd/YefM family antitoxin [Protofrankia]|uniref:type II toxin-antitoxin system Phd/YefM family antitoxin n=1 Tax=Protofrankia TaxID=2994361 RepID=UPI001F362961|nr:MULTISPECIES: type II toxin-antitoxin system prevent-host-death family antitoxin [Protofrankia]